MSFCNPSSIDDYFLDAPDESNGITVDKTVKDAVGTPQEFSIRHAEESSGPTPSNLTTADTQNLHNNLKNTAASLSRVGAAFSRIGFDSRRVEDAYSKVLGADGSISIGNFFRNFRSMSGALLDIEATIGSGLGLENQEWFKTVERATEQSRPFIQFVDKIGQIVNNSDTGGTLVTDQILTSIFVDITNASSSIFGEDNGLTRAIAGMTELVTTAQGVVSFLAEAQADLEDAAIAVIDTAESMMVAGLGMAASICEFIPVFIAMSRAMVEMIRGLIAALEAFLSDPLGNLPKFKLDIDFSKLFRLPDLATFRRLRSRWDRFTGTAFKSWKTTATECSADAWNSRLQGPGRVSEAATSLSGAMLYGAQLATAASNAPEGINRNGGLGKSITDNGANAIDLINRTKSMLMIKPAVVNPTPSTPELSFKSGSSIPADLSATNLPNGLGSLNGLKSFEIDPSTGFPVRPGIQGSISNNLEVMADMCGTLRAGEICAANTYSAGRALKNAALGGDSTAALKELFEASRRMRFIQSGTCNNSELSQIAKDYYACQEKAMSSRYNIGNMNDAQAHLGSAMSSPAGLPGSVLERAAINNPASFLIGNNVGVVKDFTSDNTPPSNSIDPSSILGQLSTEDILDKTKLTDPNQTINSPASDRVDQLIDLMPLGAMPINYYDSGQLNALSGLIRPDASNLSRLPWAMLCRDSNQSKQLAAIESLQILLDSIDPVISDRLFQKAQEQGLLDSNSYTWLSVGKKIVINGNLLEMLDGFLLHSKTDIRPALRWLQSSNIQNVQDPPLPINLTEEERQIAEKSFRYLEANFGDLSAIFLTLRDQADEVGGPMGYEYVMFLVCDTVLKEIENRILDNQNMQDKLKQLLPMVEKLTHFKPMIKQVKTLAEGTF